VTTTGRYGKREAPAGIEIITSRLRSTNLDRDVSDPHLSTTYVGARTQDILARIASAMLDTSRPRAWSLTGPYGSGKSTIALLTASLLDPDVTLRVEADKVLADASAGLAVDFANARDLAAPDGFITCVTTARREPLIETISRAIRQGAERTWSKKRPPSAIKAPLDALATTGVTHLDVIAAIRALCGHKPVLLIIDEFGKSLEHLASRGEFGDAGSDVFLLQELAELGAGSRGLPLYLLTLQHQSFADYASRTTVLQTREWAKIQGRFEDIHVTTHLGDAVELTRRTLNHTGATGGRKAIKAHAAAAAEAWTARGLDGLVPADPTLFADLYPLHPLAAVTAPLLATQIGQHDRSMTGFIAGDEPHTVHRFLQVNARAKPSMASTVRLGDVFDYFFTAGRTTLLASANASRWIEIESRIAQANGRPDDELAVLKTIAVLNLVDASGALRASMDTILFALCDPVQLNDAATRQYWHEVVERLEAQGFLVYREFSDEYRLWQGSDVDLNAHIALLMDSCDDHTATKSVSLYLPNAVVAGRHSQRTGMLRYFQTAASDTDFAEMTWPAEAESADGLLLFHFGPETTIPAVQCDRPVIAGVTTEAKNVLNAARYLHALQELPTQVDLDAAASFEVSERRAQAVAELAARLAEAFAPHTVDATWFLLTNDAGTARWTSDSAVLAGRSLAALVSDACERVFPDAPHIRNEMLGRHTLTSQGAKARRELVTAMITSPQLPRLGIEGYGPERAMYHGVLEYLGLHGPTGEEDDGQLTYGFHEPESGSSLYPAWTALTSRLQQATTGPVRLDQIHRTLEDPPYGVRPGITPIVVLTALIVWREEIALFEEGTYQTRLTDALVERMLKNPERFTVKAMGTQTGARKEAVVEIAKQLGTRLPPAPPPNARNTQPLAVTRTLLDRVRGLSTYADRTQELSDQARAVRAALKSAREPDTLLFADLPKALGLKPVPARGRADGDARSYGVALVSAMVEIAEADQRLREQVLDALIDAFRIVGGRGGSHPTSRLDSLRRRLRLLTAPLAAVTLVEPRLRGVIAHAQDETLSDDEWLDPLVVRIVNRGLSDWRDGDLATFTTEARALSRAIERLANIHQAAEPQQSSTSFSTRSITLTRGDGTDEHAVIQIPDDALPAAQELVHNVIKQARKVIGEHGERVLLALLAETVVAGEHTGAPKTPVARKKPRR
jgi:hypothetical protein